MRRNFSYILSLQHEVSIKQKSVNLKKDDFNEGPNEEPHPLQDWVSFPRAIAWSSCVFFASLLGIVRDKSNIFLSTRLKSPNLESRNLTTKLGSSKLGKVKHNNSGPFMPKSEIATDCQLGRKQQSAMPVFPYSKVYKIVTTSFSNYPGKF